MYQAPYRRKKFHFVSKLCCLISSHIFVIYLSRRGIGRIKSFYREFGIPTMVRRAFYVRRWRFYHVFSIKHYVLIREWSISRYQFNVSTRRDATCNSFGVCFATHPRRLNQALSAGPKQWPFSNHVKRRSSPLVGIIQTSVRRSCLAAPVQRLSIFVMFRRWNSDATSASSASSASSARLRTDRHPSTWRNIDYLSPTMNNRVEFAYYVRDFWRKVRSTADLRWGTDQIRCELSSNHAKPEVVSDVRIRNILGGSCR